MTGMTPLGQRLAEVRIAAGYTQSDLEEAAGVPQTTVSRIETGETKNPNVHTVAKVAAVLGVPIESLLSRSAAPPLPQDRLAKAESQNGRALRVALRGGVSIHRQVSDLQDRVEQLERALRLRGTGE